MIMARSKQVLATVWFYASDVAVNMLYAAVGVVVAVASIALTFVVFHLLGVIG